MAAPVTLPWPDKRLSPNFRCRSHWPITRAKRRARELAHQVTVTTLPLSDRRAVAAGDGPIYLEIIFYPPIKRNRDEDNLIASMKAALDGIADALGVDDQRFRGAYAIASKAGPPGRVEVRFAALEVSTRGAP